MKLVMLADILSKQCSQSFMRQRMGIVGLCLAFSWVNKGGICSSDLNPVDKGRSLQWAAPWNTKGKGQCLPELFARARGSGKFDLTRRNRSRQQRAVVDRGEGSL